MEPSWKAVLNEEFDKPYFKNLIDFVADEYDSYSCFPPKNQIFAAFDHTPFENVKVVIIGQDPYHGLGQAHGLCFSVNEGVKKPPSLHNIFKKLNLELDIPIPESGNLNRWADQGVFLLNSILTVREKKAGSHKNKGWEEFTDAVIEKLASEKNNLVFMLWGNYAKKKGENINENKHELIKSIHPSPQSVNFNKDGWYKEDQFIRANKYLIEKGKLPIKW